MATFNFPVQTYTAGAHVVGPFVMPSNVNKLEVDFTVSAPDISDPTETMDYMMECFDGTNWLFDNGFSGWNGGQVSKFGQPVQPQIVVNGLSHLWGKQCRITITLSKVMTTAITVLTT